MFCMQYTPSPTFNSDFKVLHITKLLINIMQKCDTFQTWAGHYNQNVPIILVLKGNIPHFMMSPNIQQYLTCM